MVELTVPWETRMEEAHERKLLRYSELAEECRANRWECVVYAVEVGCRGFVGLSLRKFLVELGLDKAVVRRAVSEIQEAAERSSGWILRSSDAVNGQSYSHNCSTCGA